MLEVMIIKLPFVEQSLCARHCGKDFTNIVLSYRHLFIYYLDLSYYDSVTLGDVI